MIRPVVVPAIVATTGWTPMRFGNSVWSAGLGERCQMMAGESATPRDYPDVATRNTVP